MLTTLLFSFDNPSFQESPEVPEPDSGIKTKKIRKKHEIKKAIPGRPRNTSINVISINDRADLEVLSRLRNLKVFYFFTIGFLTEIYFFFFSVFSGYFEFG